MRALRAIRAELRKIVTLPASLVALALTVLGPLGFAVFNALGVRSDLAAGNLDRLGYTSAVEAALSAVPLGTVGAVILGVVAVSHEYTANSSDAGGGRQITATLTVVPGRLTVLVAKTISVTLLIVAAAAVALPGSLAAAALIIGDEGGSTGSGEVSARAGGAALYWVLMGVIALAITVLTRSGVVPLIVLIANSSLVSVSILLANLTDLAYLLPDLAGMRLFTGDATWAMTEHALPPLAGGLVMGAWAAGLVAVAAVVLRRRDA